MPPIATNELWLEQLPELLIRWYSRQSDDRLTAIGLGAAEMIPKVRQRAEKVQTFCKLPKVERLRTSREWDTRWDAVSHWKVLVKAAARVGCRVERLLEAGPLDCDVVREIQGSDERPAIALTEGPVQELVNLAQNNGLSLRFGTQESACIILAEEIYAQATGRMGRLALDWVEELARPLFVQNVLGLPFNPLAFHFLASAPPTA